MTKHLTSQFFCYSFFLKVPLACLGNKAQGSRASGTLRKWFTKPTVHTRYHLVDKSRQVMIVKSSLESSVDHAVDDEAGAGDTALALVRGRSQDLVRRVIEGAALPPRHLR